MNSRIRFLLLARALIPFLVLLLPLRCQAEPSPDRTLSPYFLVEGTAEGVDHFPLKSTEVTTTVTGVIAEVYVRQRYTNEGTVPLHAQYVFPASTRASVHELSIQVGERRARALIQRREEAKKTFSEAKKAGKSASLLEQERPNVFTMSVANIMPGDTVEVDLRYSELLIPTDNTYEFVYPTVVGPRYSNQAEGTSPEHDRWIKSPYLPGSEDRRVGDFHITVLLAAGMPVAALQSPSHEVEVDWRNRTAAEVRLKDDQQPAGNRDFILHYRLVGDQIQSGLLLNRGEHENFFLLTVQPPKRVEAAAIPPREYIFVVDVSGSMSGFPLDTAKKVMHDLLGNLRSQDSFNLILFAGSSYLFSQTSVPASADNIAKATAVLDRQQGGGGTELLSALATAALLPKNEGVSRTIAILTDGYISVEQEAFRLIQNSLHQTNFFAFGIGSSVNRFLIEGIAKAGHGEPFVVTDPSQATATADAFRRYIESPVLTGVAVSINGFEAYDLEPAKQPDLFAERPIVVIGKWRGEPRGTIVVTGTTGTGPFRAELPVGEEAVVASASALPFLWARERIARLSDYAGGEPSADRKEEITQLGLSYSLLTKYTSFVAVIDEVRNPSASGADVKQPLPLPQGVSPLAVGGAQYASGSEPELEVLLPLLALLLYIVRTGNRPVRRTAS